MIFSKSDFIIFISVVMAVYSAGSIYVFARARRLLTSFRYRYFIYALFAVGFISYPLGRFLGNHTANIFFDVVRAVGSFYGASLLYMMFVFILRDIINFAGEKTKKFEADFGISEKKKPILMLAIASIVAAIITAGYINASIIRIVKYQVTLDKRSAPPSTLRCALVSDIHLGRTVSSAFVDSLVKKINSIRPDIVFVAGDIIDRNSGELAGSAFSEKLRMIDSRYGVYASLGNHDMFSNIKKNVSYINSSGMILLADKKVLINGLFYVVGRVDSSAPRFGETRSALDEILRDAKDLPVIVMDHTPAGLDEAYKNRVALQLSGHTHNGQMFPINIVTSFIFDISYGLKEINGTKYIVTCGTGTWGPGVRIGTSPEVVEIDIEFR